MLAGAMTDFMAGHSFSRLSWQCRQIAQRLGIVESLALGLIMASVALHFYAIAPAKKNVTELARSTEQLRVQIQNQKAASVKQTTPSEQLEAFYKILPKSSSAPDELKKLYEAAKAQNITLDQGEYRMTRDENEKISRYEIVLPVKGNYPQIRKFVNQVLKDIPTIALEGVTFQRQKVGEAVTQSQIRFTLYLGEG